MHGVDESVDRARHASIEQQLRERRHRAFSLDRPWRFANSPELHGRFATSAHARQFLAEIADLNPVDLGDDVRGFANFEIGF